MMQYNNCDKLSIVTLFIIIKILQQSCCNENINKTSKKNSTNIKHKENVNLNNLSVKKNVKYKMNTECMPPIKEVYFEDDAKCIPFINEVYFEDDTESIPPINKVYIEDDTEYMPPINEVYIKVDTESIPPINEVYFEDDSKCIKKNIKNKDELNNTTDNGIYEIPKNVKTIYNENLISTLPIISKKNIDIRIESTFEFENATLEINSMKKHIYLTNSKVLPMYENHDISHSFF